MHRHRIIAAALLCTACQEGDLESLGDAWARDGLYAGADADAHGEFTTRIWDMTDGTSKVTHHLVDEVARIDTEIVLEDGVELQRAAVFDAWGEYDAEGRLHVDSYEAVQLPLIEPEPRDPRRIALIIVTWEGEGLGLDNKTGRDNMFTGDKSTNVFYGENSYGVETMAGDVFGPYTIDDPGGCSPGQIQFLGMDALAQAGFDRQHWRQFMFYFPTQSCGFAGLAGIGSPDMPSAYSWYNGSFQCNVRNQELGHNYGMAHSHSYDCSDDTGIVPFSENCTAVEYGHPYDPMGGEGGSGCGHINVAQKRFMGWIEGCNVVTATSDGTFNLLPIELPCDGPQAVRFPTFDGRYYWLEYRTGRGLFDGNLDEGILVHVAAETTAAPASYFLDMGPGDFFYEGDSFTDPQGVVTFEALEFNGTHAVVRATFAEPSGDAPTCLDGSDPGMQGGHVGMRECADDLWQPDMEKPQITVTFPEDEAWFEPGADFIITADVTDDRGVVDVELFLDNEPLFRLTEPPWQWEVTNIPEGDYNIGAVARDSRHFTNSNAVDIHVGEMPPSADTGGGSSGDESGSTTDALTTGPASEDSGDPETDTEDPGETMTEAEGCTCSTNGRPNGLLLFLVPLFAGAVRRRRP